VLFWDFIQRRMVDLFRRFGTTYCVSHFQEPCSPSPSWTAYIYIWKNARLSPPTFFQKISRKTSDMISGLHSEIRTQDLPHTKQQCCDLNQDYRSVQHYSLHKMWLPLFCYVPTLTYRCRRSVGLLTAIP